LQPINSVKEKQLLDELCKSHFRALTEDEITDILAKK
jgi:hypothetical protein